MPFIPGINWLFVMVAAVILAAPYMVAKLAYWDTRNAPSVLVSKVIKYYCIWLLTIFAEMSLFILQLEQFSWLTLIVYFILMVAVAVVSLCVLIVTFAPNA